VCYLTWPLVYAHAFTRARGSAVLYFIPVAEKCMLAAWKLCAILVNGFFMQKNHISHNDNNNDNKNQPDYNCRITELTSILYIRVNFRKGGNCKLSQIVSLFIIFIHRERFRILNKIVIYSAIPKVKN